MSRWGANNAGAKTPLPLAVDFSREAGEENRLKDGVGEACRKKSGGGGHGDVGRDDGRGRGVVRVRVQHYPQRKQ